MKLIFFLFILIVSFTTCSKLDGTDYRLRIKNNSNISIYGNTYYTYPDTSIAEHFANIKINSNSERRIPTQVSWERIFNDELKSDTLMIIIFNSEVIENTSLATVRKNYMIYAFFIKFFVLLLYLSYRFTPMYQTVNK